MILLIDDDSRKLADENPFPNELKELINNQIKINLNSTMK
jgi:hypothetical protein